MSEAGRLTAFGLGGLGGLPEQLGQDGGLAVVDIPGRGQQRQGFIWPGRRERAQPAERGLLRGPGELIEVAPAELLEPGRIMPVPFT
jgi:hypothetical protein